MAIGTGGDSGGGNRKSQSAEVKIHRLFREEQIVLFQAELGGLKRGNREDETKKVAWDRILDEC